MRFTNLARLDLSDLASVRAALGSAQDAGHWRRILAIYGDHLPACAVRVGDGRLCDCGWELIWGQQSFDNGENTGAAVA